MNVSRCSGSRGRCLLCLEVSKSSNWTKGRAPPGCVAGCGVPVEEVRVQLGGGVKHCGCSHRRVLQTTRAREGTASSAFIIVKNAQDLFRHLRRTNALKKHRLQLTFTQRYRFNTDRQCRRVTLHHIDTLRRKPPDDYPLLMLLPAIPSHV